MNTRSIFFLIISSIFPLYCFSQSRLAAKFNLSTMTFKGSKVEQAKYLLKPVKKFAHLGNELTVLPDCIGRLLNETEPIVLISKMDDYLTRNNIDKKEIGGFTSTGLSKTTSNVMANYFVIHDSSNLIPNPQSDSFPPLVDLSTWSGNMINNKVNFPSAHLFINRLGQSITSNDFSKRIQGTKFESKIKNPVIHGQCLGDFIHIEMIQPRKSDKGKNNDAIAINPGFTPKQYERLALIYIVASLRKGSWLVPVYHAVLDEGIPDGHDDPQNFNLQAFDSAIAKILKEL